MTCLASDTNFLKSRGETVFRGIIVLVHSRGVTLSAHEIPVLVQLCPMQHIIVPNSLVRIKVKPSLTTLRLGPSVPGNRQRLYPAVWKLDEILLKWLHPERVLDFERCEFSVVSICFNEILSFPVKKSRLNAIIFELGVVEVAEDRVRGSVGHRLFVLRRLPELGFLFVATSARCAADERDRR